MLLAKGVIIMLNIADHGGLVELTRLIMNRYRNRLHYLEESRVRRHVSGKHFQLTKAGYWLRERLHKGEEGPGEKCR